jgi:hypothetical protein
LNSLQDKDPKPVLSLIYYFGGLTYSHNSPSPNTKLVIPNLLAEREFLDHLKTVIELEDTLFSICRQWIEDKDISHFCSYLTSNVLHKFQNRDVKVGEDAFSPCMYIIFFSSLFKNKKVNFQKKKKIGVYVCLALAFGKGLGISVIRETLRGGKYSDVEVHTENEIFILELKNLQIQYFDEWNATNQSNDDWKILTAWDKSVLAKKTDEEILEMRGTFFLNFTQGKKNISVRQIMEEAESQLQGYMKTAKTQNPTKNIYGYVLIRVGLSKILHKKLELQRLK